MIQWLYNMIFGGAYAVGSATQQIMYDVLKGMQGWIQDLLTNEKFSWSKMSAAGRRLEYGTWVFGRQVSFRLWWLRWVGLQWVSDYAKGLVLQLRGWAQALFTYLNNRVNDLRNQTWIWIVALTWTIVHVLLPPILSAIATLVKQMLQWAYVAWYFITHPPSLAALLFWPLFAIFKLNPFTIGRTVGDWAFKLVLTQFVASSKLAEQIITDVL